ncbi:MAG: PilZ domain-containing protein [Deltaproteobacteria bacterium]|nr:PilZ domain-containing protein [Deltaproteobacteria bacterium]
MKTQRPYTDGNDRRQAIRMPYQTLLMYANHTATGLGRVRDISFEGLFLETPRTFAVGDQLDMDFQFRHGQMNMAIMGQITRITPTGVGVKLLW